MQTLFGQEERRTQSDQTPERPYPCDGCGSLAPTKYVEFRQNIGVMVMRFRSQVTGWLCKRCIHRHFWKMTTINLTCGWWGTISFFATIVYTIGNTYYYLSSLKLEASLDSPDAGYAGAVPDHPAPPVTPYSAAKPRQYTEAAPPRKPLIDPAPYGYPPGAIPGVGSQVPWPGSNAKETAQGRPDEDDEVKGSRAQGIFLLVLGGALTGLCWLEARGGTFYTSMALIGPFLAVFGLGTGILPPPDHGKSRKPLLITYSVIGVIVSALNIALLLA